MFWSPCKVEWRKVFPDMENPRCPVSGCRAPELATGMLDRMLSDLAEMGSCDLIREFPEGLSDEGRTVVLAYFAAAKAYLELGLSIKMDCWKRRTSRAGNAPGAP